MNLENPRSGERSYNEFGALQSTLDFDYVATSVGLRYDLASLGKLLMYNGLPNHRISKLDGLGRPSYREIDLLGQ